jgi:hypothetical protein
MRRPVPHLVVALLCVAGLALCAGRLLTGEVEAPPVAVRTRTRAPAPAKPTPVLARAVPVGETDLDGAFDRFFGECQVTPAPGVSPRQLLADATAAGSDPVDARLELERALRTDAAARVALADALADLPAASAAYAFPAALALSAHVDGPTTERLIARIGDTPARNRPNLVLALRGSTDPRADVALVGLYGDEDPAVRDQAAFVLGERGQRLPDEVRAPALARARAGLVASDPAGWSAAADVLGAPPLAGTDRALLVDLLAHDRAPERRLLALRALAGAGVASTADDVRPALEAAATDPLAGDALRAAAAGALRRS